MASNMNSDFRTYEKKYVYGKERLGSSNCFSNLFFMWVAPRMSIAQKYPYDQDMHSKLKKEDTAKDCFERLHLTWHENIKKIKDPEKETSGSYLLGAVMRAFKWQLMGAWFLGIWASLSDYAATFVVYMALGKFKNYEPSKDNEYQIYYDTGIIVGLLGVTSLFSCTIDAFQNFKLSVIGARMANGVKCLIYDKMLKKSTEREKLFSLGEITNIIQVDAANFEAFADNGGLAFILPIEICGGLIGLYLMMGWAILPAAGVVVFAGIINIIVSGKYKAMKKAFMGAKDTRAKLMIELFENIRYVKLTGLESRYVANGLEKKEEEISVLKRLLGRYLFSSIFNELTPSLFVISINAFYIWMHGSLSVQKVFTSMLILNIFKRNLRFLPELMVFMIDLTVSARRISYYLLSEEVDFSFIRFQDPKIESEEAQQHGYSVLFERGNFFWNDEDKLNSLSKIKDLVFKSEKNTKSIKSRAEGIAGGLSGEKGRLQASAVFLGKQQAITGSMVTVNNESLEEPLTDHLDTDVELDLKAINLRIKRKGKIAIVGKIGSGKSTILNSLLGELYHSQESTVSRDRRIAYTSQQPFIFGGTILDNILMGREYDEQRFNSAIQGSGMSTDLAMMKDRENTILGNKGIGLSGGQRTRLTIARALYTKADLYLFDDPISALDINVGKEVMEKGILGLLKEKTVIVATHASKFLPYFDQIIVMESGKIVFQGDFSAFSQSEFQISEEEDQFENLKLTHKKSTRNRPSLMEEVKEYVGSFQESHRSRIEQLERKTSSKTQVGNLEASFDNRFVGSYQKRNRLKSDEVFEEFVQEVEIQEHHEPDEIDEPVLLSKRTSIKKSISKLSRERSGTSANVEQVIKKFTSMEDKAVGSIGWDVIKKYFNMLGKWRIFIVPFSKIF